MSNPNDVPMIPKHEAEMHNMHLTHMNSSMRNLCIAVAVLFTIAIVAVSWAAVSVTRATVEQSKVFVDNYTARTEKWLETLTRMQTGHGTTEVLNEKENAGYIQQPTVP